METPPPEPPSVKGFRKAALYACGTAAATACLSVFAVMLSLPRDFAKYQDQGRSEFQVAAEKAFRTALNEGDCQMLGAEGTPIPYGVDYMYGMVRRNGELTLHIGNINAEMDPLDLGTRKVIYRLEARNSEGETVHSAFRESTDCADWFRFRRPAVETSTLESAVHPTL